MHGEDNTIFTEKYVTMAICGKLKEYRDIREVKNS
jgi:hypothetical protein